MIDKQDITEHIATHLFDRLQRNGHVDPDSFDRAQVCDHDFFHSVGNYYEDSLQKALGDDWDEIWCDWVEALVDECWDAGVEQFENMCADSYHDKLNAI